MCRVLPVGREGGLRRTVGLRAGLRTSSAQGRRLNEPAVDCIAPSIYRIQAVDCPPDRNDSDKGRVRSSLRSRRGDSEGGRYANSLARRGVISILEIHRFVDQCRDCAGLDGQRQYGKNGLTLFGRPCLHHLHPSFTIHTTAPGICRSPAGAVTSRSGSPGDGSTCGAK